VEAIKQLTCNTHGSACCLLNYEEEIETSITVYKLNEVGVA